MATNLGNRVTYRSPDALQNLRLKVTLTRISGPRMDRAREMDARFGSGPTPQAQIQAAQQQAQQACPRRARAARPRAPAAVHAPAGAAGRTDPVAELRRRRARGRGRRRHDVRAGTIKCTARRDRESKQPTQQEHDAAGAGRPPGQGIPQQQAQAPFDPYGGNKAGPAGGPSPRATRPRRARRLRLPEPPARGGVDGRRRLAFAARPQAARARARRGGRRRVPSATRRIFRSRRSAWTPRVRTYTREIAWQEKIFSVVDVDRLARREPETELERKYAAMIHERGAENAGEIIYSYVSADSFADERDAERVVTTSAGERWNGLFRAVFGTPSQRVLAKNASGRDATRLRTELAHGRRRRAGTEPSTFAICADCGPLSLPPAHPVFKNSPSGVNAEREQVLMTIEAYPDGSIALTPDFSQSVDDTRRIERRDGSVWEYSVVNASERGKRRWSSAPRTSRPPPRCVGSS